ncbi:MAG: hypothetical protein CMH26_01755 [Micavibrio sp.]|nr:hypothetical protein [Micavibrio sp.]|tara:strand:+ start:1140 stop:1499 length:360 start_codon:yes stop_codon:yes gene_type:complete
MAFINTLIRTILGIFLVAVLTAFAILNRGDTAVSISPVLPAIDMPLYFVAMGFLVFGFVFGALFSWFSQGKVRQARRVLRKEKKALEKELELMRAKAGLEDVQGDSGLIPIINNNIVEE